jgi:succinyl-CoA synthetase beta subunit
MAMLDYMEAADLLSKYKIKSERSRYVSSSDKALEFAGKKKIAMKVISGNAIHKSKLGLVKVDLSYEDIPKAFSELSSAGKKFAPYKILAQEMADPGVEAIIGGKIDSQFGKMILIGLGGIYVEILKDFALRVCPIKKEDAYDMIYQLHSQSIITYNGDSREIVADLLMKVSKMISEENITELDLNPVIIRKNGYSIVDIRIIR